MAAITFRMDSSKDLIATSSTKIYQQENNVDSIAILLPCTYSDMDLAEFAVKLKYIDMANLIHEEELVKDEEVYKEQFYRYVFPITKEFTQIAGEISFMIEISQGEEFVLHTGTVTINILPWKDYRKEG